MEGSIVLLLDERRLTWFASVRDAGTTDMKEALEWGRKAVVACRAPVEVRQFHSL
jgi:hypothetical protein